MGNVKNICILWVEVVGIDLVYDLVILKVEDVLILLKVGIDEYVLEGIIIGFIGYLIGVVLGLYLVMYCGMVVVVMFDVMLVYNLI